MDGGDARTGIASGETATLRGTALENNGTAGNGTTALGTVRERRERSGWELRELVRPLTVIPLTSVPVGRNARWDEVVVEPGISGLRVRSVTVSDQVRSIDRQRIERRIGRVSDAVMARIDHCLECVLALT